MIAYSIPALDALLTKAAAREWHDQGLLSGSQWQAIQAAYPTNFYSPNVFVRIGLAIFCSILLFSAMGLTAMIFDLDAQAGFAVFSIFWGVVCIALLERWAIQSARHYGSGMDDMLLYFGVGALITGLCILMPYNATTLVYCCVALPFLVIGSLRYLDRLLAAAAFVCALLIVLLTVKEIPRLALFLLPFSGMLFSAAAYFFARSGQKRPEQRHWHSVLGVVETLALITFYASGNFWVVQQAGAEFFQLERVPMAWFFWSFTYVVPVLYIFLGLRQKDRLLLDIGLACVAAMVFTFRYYFHVMPLAWAATLAGAVLFALAYFSIRYLRKNEATYTYAAGSEKSLLQEIEQQLVEQTIASQAIPATARPDSFGGGQFGGGGAGQDF